MYSPLYLCALMGSAKAVVSTIGQVRHVSAEAYDQITGSALDADARDVPTFGEAPAEEVRTEAEMDVEPAAQRSSLTMVPRSLKHPTRPATGE